MSLRVRVELVLFLTFGLVIGLSYGIQRFVIVPSIAPLEKADVDRALRHVVAALAREEDDLLRLAASWAARPEAVAALGADSQTVAAEGPLDLLDLEQANVSGAYLVDATGQLRWSYQGLDAYSAPIHLPAFMNPHWSTALDLFKTGSVGYRGAGVWITERGPALLAIKASGGEAGWLVLCRMLDREFLDRVNLQSAVSFQVWGLSDPLLTTQDRDVIALLSENMPTFIDELSLDTYRAYATYPDILGAPALLLRADIHRNLREQAEITLQNGLLAQVGIGLLALVVLTMLFRQTVMASLSRLTAHTVRIGKTNDLTSRIDLNRSDELGTLAVEFNRMVAQLEADRKQEETIREKLHESEERYALAVRGANDGLWDWDLVRDEVYFSPRWITMLGYEVADFGSTSSAWLDRIHGDDRANVVAALEAHKQGESDHFESEYRMQHSGGNFVWVLCRGLSVKDPSGTPTRMAGSQTDITLRKLFEEQLRYQASHDSLTSLPNRALFLDRMAHTLKTCERDKDYTFAVMFLDLDRFKVLNDGLGHVVGDRLLNMFAERLQHILRAVDTVCRHSGTLARFGGDEFVMLLDNISGVGDAILVARRLERVLQDPFLIDGNEIFTTASIGIALGTHECTSAEELIRNADTAMYRAKARGKACFEIFDADMNSLAVERLQLENDLRRAVERDEFCVYYQPIVSLTSGEIVAFESLVRWMHPERGMVSPLEFIPIAEETGMIVAIGETVLRASCCQLKLWQETMPAYKHLGISVNLSVKEFSKPNLIGSIMDALSLANLDPRYLKLEITESALMEGVELVTRTLRQIREMNIQLSIDDFGTGYSSLSYLHRFPMNNLKVDQAFIRDMMTCNESGQIVKTVILLAEALSMSTIAEGIESNLQVCALRDLNCGSGQGYFFSRPLPLEEATALLASKPVWAQDGTKTLEHG